MPVGPIGPKWQASGKLASDVAPMIGRRIARVDAGPFHRVDRLENSLNLWPAVDPKQ